MKKNVGWKITILLLPIIILIGYALFSRPDTSIEALIAPETRLRAYHTMWSSQDEIRDFELYKPILNYSNFRSLQNAIFLYEMPQKDAPDAPLYLVLRDEDPLTSSYPNPPWTSWTQAKQYENWKNWFSSSSTTVVAPPLAERLPDRMTSSQRYTVSLHDSDGTILDDKTPRPFRGGNVISEGEIIYDINKDEWVERVTIQNLGFRDSKVGATTVTVTRINKTTDVIFSVLVNVENPKSDPELAKSSWGFDCIDTNNDGSMELQIGEIIGAAFQIKPMITFFWDDSTETFVTKSPAIGEHYRVLNPYQKKNWVELQEMLDAGKLRYPFDK